MKFLALAVGVIVIYQNDTQSLELFIVMNKVVNFMAHTSQGFTQDDAHIFCTPDQLDHEFKAVIDLVLYVFSSLGFEHFYSTSFCSRPKQAPINTLERLKIGTKPSRRL
ncbi:MAG: hypothetical protein CM15mP32_1520 [Flavobacteriaceae bacterium]|nr:MAG: hypothetical protein CM15mP32_1520 [Flavobacteriaceae bacterium]